MSIYLGYAQYYLISLSWSSYLQLQEFVSKTSSCFVRIVKNQFENIPNVINNYRQTLPSLSSAYTVHLSQWLSLFPVVQSNLIGQINPASDVRDNQRPSSQQQLLKMLLIRTVCHLPLCATSGSVLFIVLSVQIEPLLGRCFIWRFYGIPQQNMRARSSAHNWKRIGCRLVSVGHQNKSLIVIIIIISSNNQQEQAQQRMGECFQW